MISHAAASTVLTINQSRPPIPNSKIQLAALVFAWLLFLSTLSLIVLDYHYGFGKELRIVGPETHHPLSKTKEFRGGARMGFGSTTELELGVVLETGTRGRVEDGSAQC